LAFGRLLPTFAEGPEELTRFGTEAEAGARGDRNNPVSNRVRHCLRSRFAFYGGILAVLILCVLYATSMPGTSYSGALPPSTREQRDLQARLHGHVTVLARAIGIRNVDRNRALTDAREYITAQLKPLETAAQRVQFEGVGVVGGNAQNVIFEVAGQRAKSVVVVGAHYDSCEDGPGANDNGSGVAATLELAASLARAPADGVVRFVLFANEEPPYFKNPAMGSYVNATNARKRQDPISAMLSLETIGYYSDAADSQHYPWPVGLLYPNRGNFLGFVGDLGSRSLVRSAIASFRSAEQFPSEGASLPSFIPGVEWSDHWAFRQAGYPAMMITDTALFRDPNYHRSSDTAEHLDYERLARVTRGIEAVVRQLAKGQVKR
jgi:Peptidase family M28